jgi:hypothetical protein
MNNCKFNTKYGMRQNKKFWSKLIVFPQIFILRGLDSSGGLYAR